MFAETKCADSCEKKMQNVCRITENPYLCNRKRKNAEIAQLVEHNLAKVRVASSTQVAELVDAHVSGACVERHAGSSPVLGTKILTLKFWRGGGIGRRATLRG